MTTNIKIDWIFFDLDGTLADSLPAMYQVYLNYLTDFGQNGSKEEFEELNGPSLVETPCTSVALEQFASAMSPG